MHIEDGLPPWVIGGGTSKTALLRRYWNTLKTALDGSFEEKIENCFLLDGSLAEEFKDDLPHWVVGRTHGRLLCCFTAWVSGQVHRRWPSSGGHWWRHINDSFAETVLEHIEDCLLHGSSLAVHFENVSGFAALTKLEDTKIRAAFLHGSLVVAH